MTTLVRNFLPNDKILESLARQLEGINSIIKNQLSFNKMIETQVAQLASSCPNTNLRKLPESPESPTVPFAGEVLMARYPSLQPFPSIRNKRWIVKGYASITHLDGNSYCISNACPVNIGNMYFCHTRFKKETECISYVRQNQFTHIQ